MIEWISFHNVGVSSCTMWRTLMNSPELFEKYRNDSRYEHISMDVPCDSDDFGRCYDLYKTAELNDEDLRLIGERYKPFQPIINRWKQLCEIYEERHLGYQSKIYLILEECRKEYLKGRNE